MKTRRAFGIGFIVMACLGIFACGTGNEESDGPGLTGSDDGQLFNQAISAATTRPKTIVSYYSLPDNPLFSTTVDFTYTCKPKPCTFKCNLDSAGWTKCARTGITYTDLTEGPHQFQVKAGKNGVWDKTPYIFSWDVVLGVGSWTPTSTTNAPSARSYHTAVWTGSEMIVWGGGSDLDTGARYDPTADSWTNIWATNPPHGRIYHTAVWDTANAQMIVWGGEYYDTSTVYLNTGGIYKPSANTWTATSTTNAPIGRTDHTMVWTGSKVIVWGGSNNGRKNDGGIYDPVANSWTATNTANAPAGRAWHSAVWASGLATPVMIVWGGYVSGTTNTGAMYDPAGNSWTTTSTTNAPSARYWHSAVWTGSKMIVWGGRDYDISNTGAQYDPSGNSWTPTSTINAAAARQKHPAVWVSGLATPLMMVWGGETSSTGLRSGGGYDPVGDTWTIMETPHAPEARYGHSMVSTGNKIIVWGGTYGMTYNNGGVYTP